MSKSLLYTVNQTDTLVAVGGVVPLGSIVRRKGCEIQLNGNAIYIQEPGYYDVDVSATFFAAAAGDTTITLFQNGVEVPGATATETITTALTEDRSITIPATVRVTCCADTLLTVVLTGNAATLTNFTVRVVRE